MESTLLRIPESSTPETSPRSSDLSDFDKLKKERQDKRSEKLKKYLQLLKRSDMNVSDEEKLISDIIHESASRE